jgi:hypothetical protein
MSAISNPVRLPEPAEPKPVQPAPPVKRPSSAWKVALGVLLLGAIGYGLYRMAAPAKQQNSAASFSAIKTVAASNGPLVRTLRVSGVTSARNFANLTAPIMRGPEGNQPMILLQLAKAGSFIKKGDLVATIDAQSVQDHVDDIKDTIAQATNDVRVREAEQAVEWETLQQSLRVAKANLDKAIWDAKATEVRSDIDKELFKLAIDEADARYKQAQNEVAFRKKSQGAELQILKLTLERHRRHLGRHEHDLERFTIHAPMDGLIVMQTVFRGGEMTQIQLGDQLAPGQPFMKIVDVHSMQVEANINQAETSDLRIGQPVDVGFDAFPELKLKGKVYSIGALAVGGWRQQYFIRNVPVRVAIDGYDPRVIPDLSAYGDVQQESAGSVTQVPLGAVREDGGKPFLFVRGGAHSEGGFDRRQVTLGVRSNTHVAVISGIQAGEEVRLN